MFFFCDVVLLSFNCKLQGLFRIVKKKMERFGKIKIFFPIYYRFCVFLGRVGGFIVRELGQTILE